MSASKLVTCVIFAATIVLTGCGKSPPNKSVISGGSASGGKLTVSGLNAVMEDSQPTLLFCQYETTGGPRQIGCFLVVKELPSTPGRSSHVWEGSTSMNGESGRVTGKLNAGAAKLAVEYNITLQEDKSTVKDSVTIGGTDFTLDKGRVFEIDLAATPVKVVQLDVSLPQDVPATPETSDIEALAHRTLNELKQKSPELADFMSTP